MFNNRGSTVIEYRLLVSERNNRNHIAAFKLFVLRKVTWNHIIACNKKEERGNSALNNSIRIDHPNWPVNSSLSIFIKS